MRAAVLSATGPEALVDLRDDVTTIGPGPREVKVRLRATGVCHSDLSVLSGVIPSGMPAVLGHEGAGEVIEVGEQVTAVRPGQRVVISWRGSTRRGSGSATAPQRSAWPAAAPGRRRWWCRGRR